MSEPTTVPSDVPVHVGIDVSKAKLDVCLLPARAIDQSLASTTATTASPS